MIDKKVATIVFIMAVKLPTNLTYLASKIKRISKPGFSNRGT